MCGKGWVVKGYSALSEDSAVLGGLCGERGCCAIPPVVARIFSGDSTSPLTREARMWYLAWDSACLGGYAVRGDCCHFAKVVETERVDATGGASKARMPEMNAQRLCKDAKPTERS